MALLFAWVAQQVVAAPPPALPLKHLPPATHLTDQRGAPFLIAGDAAWSLIVRATREEVDRYLEDRAARGFNTILVNLIESFYADRPPFNAYGEAPFLVTDDVSTPNDRYFAHADWVIGRAAEKGFLVLLVPAYLGFDGAEQGWYRQLVNGGSTKLRAFGSYVGKRYARYNNVLWVMGGDFNPPERQTVTAIADAIRDEAPHQLVTAHGARRTSAQDYWPKRRFAWLTVNAVYTTEDVFPAARAAWQHPDHLPFFLIESRYENDRPVPFARRLIRKQGWEALLSGATGYVFGSWPVCVQEPGWLNALDSPGTRDAAHLYAFFAGRAWHRLRPDFTGVLLASSRGHATAKRVSAALAHDGSWGAVYVAAERVVAVNLSRFRGSVTAQWFDPASGRYVPAGKSLGARGIKQFTTPGLNADGELDWVLLLEATNDAR